LDCAVWRDGSHHVRPGEPVHLGPLGQPLKHPGHQAHADHHLPPPGQQVGGAFPPAAEGRPMCATGRPHVDCPPALGSAGPRAAPREEDKISPAQAVFGTPIVLLGQFLDASANVNEPELFIKFSNEKLGAAESVATRHNSARARDLLDELPADLLHAPAVLVCRDGQLPPLEPLYDGPYRVLGRSRTGSASRSATRLTPSLPAASSPSWTSPCRQRSHAAEDDPLGGPKRSHSAGCPWSRRRHAWLCRRPLLHHQRLHLHWPLQGCHHYLGLGPEPFFLPRASGFLYTRAPTRRSSLPHRPGGRN
jgi:hypothetical protein